MSVIGSVRRKSATYHQNVFKISGCKLFHFGYVISEAPDSISAKCRNQAKSERKRVRVASCTLGIVESPAIQLVDEASCRASGVEHPDEMGEYGLPYAKLKLMQKVNNEHDRWVDT